MAQMDAGDFYERYRPREVAGLPKYAQLREALRAAIADGYWAAGEQLPNESILTTITPCSLGTVQKALRELVQARIIVRRHGHGTFVTDGQAPMMSPMHLRFEDETGDIMPIFATVIAQEADVGAAKWHRYLGDDVRRVAKIDRVFQVDGVFRCFSHFYIDCECYPAFAEPEVKDFPGANFKMLLHQRYNVLIQELHQSLRYERFPDEICECIEVAQGTYGMVLEWRAIGAGGKTIYYQEAFIPPNEYRLRLDANFDTN
ncbi:GntR family transcriptional regulator [Halopseudomonas bauzanensis]|uniref:GntR family transcriptional regulator n=1 Tax=Halopseudomonas bauzanensis TaxID=653930 RepID=UPI002552291C|nr:GntR family transcriptional regulator [Halopseudomonas bauzanensis]